MCLSDFREFWFCRNGHETRRLPFGKNGLEQQIALEKF
jgi:hypothetical protein